MYLGDFFPLYAELKKKEDRCEGAASRFVKRSFWVMFVSVMDGGVVA